MSTGSSSNIIIRLQNLPNEARAIDIRRFFTGLSIPDGGVHVVGGEKGDAFINFSSDDDARQAMMKSGNICGNPIKLFLSSRSEMQTVIAQARATPSTKSSSSNVVEQNYSPNIIEQQDQNLPKIPSANAISSILAEFQAKAVQQQQLHMQQQTPTIDPTHAILLAAAQGGNNPLAIQQLLVALNEKHQQQQQQFPFQMPMITNPMNQYPQQPNGWMAQQYSNAFQQQQQRATNAAALFQQQSLYGNHNQDSLNSFQTADDPYIRVRNIPIAYSYYNIKLLFPKYKLNLADIKILNDQNGQRTGEIVLRLHTNKDVSDILSQDGRMQCFNSMLDIKKIDEYTFASAIDSFIPAHIKKTPGAAIKNCIRVTGLPKTYERKDVKRFFAGCNVTNRPGGIFIETDTMNGPTFVEFETEIDAEKAFFYNGEQMGSSTIDMYRMTKSDMENEINSLKRAPDRPQRRPPLLNSEPTMGNNRNGNSTHLLPTPQATYHRQIDTSFPIQSNTNQDTAIICLRLRNIPYSTTEKQIHDFFTNMSIQVDSCKILLDRFNRGAGEALVRFHDPKSCQMAYETKNRQIFYGRTLDLRPLTLHEFQNAALTPMLTANDLQSPAAINQHFQQQPNVKRYPPFYERDDDRRNDKRPRWDGTHNNNNNKDGYGITRNSPRVLKDEQGQDMKSNDDKQPLNDRRSSTPPISSPTNLPPLPSELNEYIGRILVLSNVTYRATREEILDFLRPYSPIPDTLKIRCDINGKPTGFGVVACETKNDALRAVTELNNQTFMFRKIYLQQR
ncbi:unnamed protein product [Adineta steineri]|uniref:RRM domain-containing protein n=1 Tax=Adineta steineri TaxID=433720 RepID=A0A815QIB5_9BILA|nr:unnamed protein product [Adineta steineri]CAF1463664.1 unnamed protein product [Adineta steineri]CAF1633917.1 unnamed protein product [Adineta steineri]